MVQRWESHGYETRTSSALRSRDPARMEPTPQSHGDDTRPCRALASTCGFPWSTAAGEHRLPDSCLTGPSSERPAFTWLPPPLIAEPRRAQHFPWSSPGADGPVQHKSAQGRPCTGRLAETACWLVSPSLRSLIPPPESTTLDVDARPGLHTALCSHDDSGRLCAKQLVPCVRPDTAAATAPQRPVDVDTFDDTARVPWALPT